jgi:hypothetical protein
MGFLVDSSHKHVKKHREGDKVDVSTLVRVEMAPEGNTKLPRFLGRSLDFKRGQVLWWAQAAKVSEEVLKHWIRKAIILATIASCSTIESSLDLSFEHVPIITA